MAFIVPQKCRRVVWCLFLFIKNGSFLFYTVARCTYRFFEIVFVAFAAVAAVRFDCVKVCIWIHFGCVSRCWKNGNNDQMMYVCFDNRFHNTGESCRTTAKKWFRSCVLFSSAIHQKSCQHNRNETTDHRMRHFNENCRHWLWLILSREVILYWLIGVNILRFLLHQT